MRNIRACDFLLLDMLQATIQLHETASNTADASALTVAEAIWDILNECLDEDLIVEFLDSK